MLNKGQKLIVVKASRQVGVAVDTLNSMIRNVPDPKERFSLEAIVVDLNRIRKQLLFPGPAMVVVDPGGFTGQGREPWDDGCMPVLAYGAPGIQQMVDDDKEQNPFDDDGRLR
jgi:hypothetical protein